MTVPEQARLVDGATLKIADARNVYVARTYAYVAGGAQGVVIVDVERPEQPRIDQTFNAGGALNDVNDVKVGDDQRVGVRLRRRRPQRPARAAAGVVERRRPARSVSARGRSRG